MKIQTLSISEWVKAGNVIKKAATKKAYGYSKPTKFRALSHMNSKKETHVWWKEDEEKSLQK